MDHVDLRTKGFFGILGVSIRLIHSRRRLFLPLALFILLPLAALSLASRPIANRIYGTKYSSLYYDNSPSGDRDRGRYLVRSLLFVLAYGIIYLLVLLLAAGAAIHAAASAYAAKETASLRRSLLRAAPRVWPKLLGTAFFAFLITLVYAIGGGFILGLTLGLARLAVNAALALRILAIVLVCAVGIVFVAGLLYVVAFSYLAVAATVLERTTAYGGSSGSCWGMAAIKKARALIRGRVFMCCAMVLLFDVLFFGVEVCWAIVLAVYYVSLAGRIAAGVVIFLALTGLLLLALTVLTVAYLVLKAWHGEAVDPVSLASGLDACAGEYERMVPNAGAAGNVHMMQHQMV